MQVLARLFVISFVITCSACSEQAKEARGFALPDGNIDAGRVVFANMQCGQCHVVSGSELTAGEQELNAQPRGISIPLGGDMTRVKTYGDLVTSIINPSHRVARVPGQETATQDGQSKMANYNEIMRVNELIDVVAYLKSKYKLVDIPRTGYPSYVYPGG